MKTETKIAEENIQEYDKGLENQDEMKIHKASCQRFLGFMKDLKVVEGTTFNEKEKRMFEQLTSQKITDLKNAIKKYDEAGI